MPRTILVTGAGSGIVRLAADPITYWMVTTDPADLARWQAVRAEVGGDGLAALERLAGCAVSGPARGTDGASGRATQESR